MGVVENHTDFAHDKTIRDILNYLEMSYVGARAMDDVEIMCRIERAIAVMNTPAIQEVFLPDFEEKYIEREVENSLSAVSK